MGEEGEGNRPSFLFLSSLLFPKRAPRGSLVFCSVLVNLLHFHPAVLEPDLDLPLSEVEQPGHLVPAVPREIHVEQKLFLQFQRLMLCIRAPLLPCGASMKPVGGRVICRGERHRFSRRYPGRV